MKSTNRFTCLMCRGEKKTFIKLDHCTKEFDCIGCKGTGKISEDNFLFQVKQGFVNYTNLEVIELYDKAREA